MSTITIDPGLLPARAVCDSSVLIPALGFSPKEALTPVCKAFWAAMVESGRDILIAAPSIAEMIRRDTKRSIPHVRGIEVVAFDDVAADILGRKFPISVLKSEAIKSGRKVDYFKYDALIVACAIRHRADCLVTLDDGQANLATAVGLKARAPGEFEKAQQVLPFAAKP